MELVVGTAGDREFSLDAQELVTGRTCVIAQSGAGKSWAIAVICESLCRAGIGFCLIDTEGEYFSLKDAFDILWIGSDENSDADIDTVDLHQTVLESVQSGLPIIFDVSETAMQEKVTRLVNILYDIESDLRKPYLLIVEEADKFIPQSRESIKKIEEISRRGRKRGLGMLVATQRPALVNKNVLSQCNSQIIGKLSIDNDLRAVDLFFSSRKEVEELAALSPGEFYVMGSLSRGKTRMRFGERRTKHRGLTPRIMPGSSKEQRARKTAEVPPQPEEEPVEVAEDEGCEDTFIPGDALPVHVNREEVLRIAETKKKKPLIRRSSAERIASADLVYLPVIHCRVRYLGGMLRRQTRSTSFFIDGLAGRCVDIESGLKFRPCFTELLGLDENSVRVLYLIGPEGATVADIESGSQLKPAAVKKAIKQLQAQKLVTEAEPAGGSPVYVPLLKHRLLRLSTKERVLDRVLHLRDGPAKDTEITPDDLRRLLKGIEPTAELVSSDIFYYPVYEVVLARPGRERRLMIDAVTGGPVDA